MPSVRCLRIEEVLYIHDRIIERTSGSHGVLHGERLASAIERPKAGFGGVELFPTIFLKAAALMHSLISDLAFVDGNKRTGTGAAWNFLAINGWDLRVEQPELVEFAVAVANESFSVEDVATWLKNNSTRL